MEEAVQGEVVMVVVEEAEAAVRTTRQRCTSTRTCHRLLKATEELNFPSVSVSLSSTHAVTQNGGTQLRSFQTLLLLLLLSSCSWRALATRKQPL